MPCASGRSPTFHKCLQTAQPLRSLTLFSMIVGTHPHLCCSRAVCAFHRVFWPAKGAQGSSSRRTAGWEGRWPKTHGRSTGTFPQSVLQAGVSALVRAVMLTLAQGEVTVTSGLYLGSSRGRQGWRLCREPVCICPSPELPSHRGPRPACAPTASAAQGRHRLPGLPRGFRDAPGADTGSVPVKCPVLHLLLSPVRHLGLEHPGPPGRFPIVHSSGLHGPAKVGAAG